MRLPSSHTTLHLERGASIGRKKGATEFPNLRRQQCDMYTTTYTTIVVLTGCDDSCFAMMTVGRIGPPARGPLVGSTTSTTSNSGAQIGERVVLSTWDNAHNPPSAAADVGRCPCSRGLRTRRRREGTAPHFFSSLSSSADFNNTFDGDEAGPHKREEECA